ncbi:hypothetical protein ACFLVS_03680 [Chloroflexota bacterium]
MQRPGDKKRDSQESEFGILTLFSLVTWNWKVHYAYYRVHYRVLLESKLGSKLDAYVLVFRLFMQIMVTAIKEEVELVEGVATEISH